MSTKKVLKVPISYSLYYEITLSDLDLIFEIPATFEKKKLLYYISQTCH